MRTTTQTFKRIMASGGARKYLVNIDLTLADNTVLHLTEADIWDNTFKIETASSGTSSFDIGSAVIGKCSFSINNFDERFNQYDFFNASAVVWVGLVGDIDNNDTQVYYRMGFYTVDEPVYASSLITLELLDNMWKFDIPLSAVTLSYPITIRNAFVAICQYCGVTLGTQTFHGDSFTIEAAPEKDMNCREFLQYMAMIGCNFLTISDTGALLVKWYNTSAIPSGTDIDGGTFDTNTTPYSDGANLNGGTFAFNDGDTADGGTFTDNSDCVWFTRNMQATFGTDVITITGVKFTINDTAYTIGTAGYMLELENPIVNANNVNTVLNLIWDVLNGFSLRTYNITTISDLSAEVGDCCILKDYKGNFFYSWITLNSFGFSNHVVQCNAVTPQRQLTKRYSKTVSAAVEATRKQTEEIISDYDLAVQLMNDVAVNAMGGYEDYEDLPTGGRVYYLSNMPITKTGNTCSFQSGSTVFKRTGDGLFVSTNGGQTWQNGYNAQTGQLIVNVLNAIGVSADWIRTGTLDADLITAGRIRDRYNYNYWDLDSGEFKLAVLPAGTGISDPSAPHSGAYVPTNSNAPASGWTSEEQKKQHVGETFYNTSNKKTYIYKSVPGEGLPKTAHPYANNDDKYWHITTSLTAPIYIIFDYAIETETNYDYIRFYERNGSGGYKVSEQIMGDISTGTSDPVVYKIDSNEFWMTWHTDSSVQKNGWEIDDIQGYGWSGTYYTPTWSSGSLPSATWTEVTYPSSNSYQWVEASLEEYIDVKASSEKEYTQQELYEMLTNGQYQNQGIYLDSATGQLLINLNYLMANTITVGGQNYNTNPLIEVRDTSGVLMNTLTKDGFKLYDTNGSTVIGSLTRSGVVADAGRFGNLGIYSRLISGRKYAYLTYGGNSDYVDVEWGEGEINSSNNKGNFSFVPYLENWDESDELYCGFSLNYLKSSDIEKVPQVTITITQYNANGKMADRTSGGVQIQGEKKFYLNYDGRQLSFNGSTYSLTDKSGMEGYRVNKDWGKNAGEYYQVNWKVVTRSASYTDWIYLNIGDNGEGWNFYLGSDLNSDDPDKTVCVGKFRGYFTGNATCSTIDLANILITTRGIWKDDTSVMWDDGSDERIKHNIQPLSDDLSIQLIDGTQPKSFEYNDPQKKGKHYGMIAQEARALLDSLGEEDAQLEYSADSPTSEIEDKRSINYQEYIPHLINYVKDLRSEIDGLKAEIKALKGE